MAKKDYEEKYTHPEMREEVKEEIQASDKDGDPGQWSVRKSQLLTQEYERRGGGYKSEQDEYQKGLQQWTEEEWQTREGEAGARTCPSSQHGASCVAHLWPPVHSVSSATGLTIPLNVDVWYTASTRVL
jgi:hypothetical protein